MILASVKNPHAVALGRRGGLKGGPARAKSLSHAHRVYYGRLAGARRAQAAKQKLSRQAKALLELEMLFGKWVDREKPPRRGHDWFTGAACDAVEPPAPLALVVAVSNPPTKQECLIVRAMTTGAVKRGYLKPKPCSSCGKDCSARQSRCHAHHVDYRLPFNVVWLCAGCHLRLHNTRFDLTA